MRWTDVKLDSEQKIDVQLGEIVDVVFDNDQKVDLGYGNMPPQDTAGPTPFPRKPDNE